jgi:integrase
MPRYNKKITSLLDYQDFKAGIQELPISRQAFLSILFFAGCRISEALALTSDDINCARDTIYIQFFRLKGSKQTDPIPLPRTAPLEWLCEQKGKLFGFCRKTGYNTVKRAFPDRYPHSFRLNRITQISDTFGDAAVYSWTGISARSIDYYRGKVDISRVGKKLHEEIG